MKHDAIKTAVLSIKMIPNADPMLREALRLEPDERSLGLITTDCDDVSYAWRWMKRRRKRRSVWPMPGACMPAREMPAPGLPENLLVFLPEKIRQEVRSGLEAAELYIERDAHFYSADDEDSVVILPSVFQERAVICRKRRAFPRGHRWLI